MDLEKRFKKETGFDAYIDNNLEPKIPMGYYVEWLEEQLKLCGVINSVCPVCDTEHNGGNKHCNDCINGYYKSIGK